MTTTRERPARLRRADAAAVLLPPPRREPRREPPREPPREPRDQHDPPEPLPARTLAITELMARRPDLHDVYTPATIAADSVLWSA
jgi:hypothetical protein